ncbi:SH3 domain-containing protein [Clostridium perfringens]|uniref:SH3 domain-containing protein n=1 Tax=Clostridium perfringens TaxID=1502 RepID=UPI0026E38313|nr:SH3 domain-containing protein [Clostridium perfringens]MDO6338451.1 SH3 domain-containing protein [Clostridium perfringens]
MANNIIPNVSSGDLVGSTPTFPPNAVVRGDFLYLRDVDGNQIPGRTVSDGDEITVLFISNEKNIVLVQYPTSSGYRQGYVTNATSIIKYKDDYSWVNGSTPEPVYDFDKTTQIGTLDPRERAVVLYKVDGMTYVAYDTGKGKLTKSGLVHYEGAGSSTGGGSFNGVAPGEVVPDGFTYENNAEVIGDELYLRDSNGNLIPGRSVSVGDRITVLDVSYSKQLALVQYPAGNVVRQGYVTNATNLIRYFNQSMWHNGSTPEEVLDENGGHLGSLDPYESATPLYKKNGMTHVVYNTSKGPNTKSGYVKYEGSAATRVDIPRPSITNAQKIVYGTSGRGRELAAYKVGNGTNSLIYVCAIHGWEDHWAADGIELTRIGNGLIEHFQNAGTNNWSLYIIPVANPDGLSEGYTNNGPGRCTIVGAVDCNRDFPIGFTPYGDSRHWTNKEPLSVPESRSLRDFISGIKGKTSGSTYLIDMHGWEDKTIGDSHISRAFQNQFGFVNGCYDGVYQGGFLISWANSIGVRAALIELPQSCYSHSDAVNGRYLQKAINAVTNLIGGSGGSSSGGSTGGNTGSGSTGGSSSSDVTYIANGEVINVQSFLNVRKGPGTNYDSIGQLNQGDNVSIVAKNREWYKISSPIDGYVHSDFIRINSNDNNDKHMEVVNKRVEDILSIFKNNLLGAKYKLAFNKYMQLYKGESFNVDFKYGVGLEFNEDALITMDFSDGKIVSENIFVQSLIDFIYVIDKKFDKMSIFIKEFEKIVENCKITIEGNLAEAAVTVTLEVKIDENKAFSTENSIFIDFKISFDVLDFIKKMLDKFGDKIAEIAGKIWDIIKNIGNTVQQMIGFVAFIVVALIISAEKLTEEVVAGILVALLGFITNLA